MYDMTGVNIFEFRRNRQCPTCRQKKQIQRYYRKQLLIFFFPIVLGTFVQQIYNTADAIVVGRFVGKEALACVGGSSAQIINLIVGFFIGLSSGATVVIAQYYGARDRGNVSRALHTAAAFAVVGSIAITVIGLVFTPSLLRLRCGPHWRRSFTATPFHGC